jgi:hypothetical protein
MLPEVEKYLKTISDAKDAYEKTREEVGKKYQVSVLADRYSHEFQRASRKARAELVATEDACRDAEPAAWEELKQSSNPMVSWIAHNVRDYYETATTVLKKLPLTEGELINLGRDQGWCETYTHFLDTARTEGVFGGKPVSPARIRMNRTLRRFVYNDQIATVQENLNEVIAEAVAEAKAEWAAALVLKKDESLADENPPSNER